MAHRNTYTHTHMYMYTTTRIRSGPAFPTNWVWCVILTPLPPTLARTHKETHAHTRTHTQSHTCACAVSQAVPTNWVTLIFATHTHTSVTLTSHSEPHPHTASHQVTIIINIGCSEGPCTAPPSLIFHLHTTPHSGTSRDAAAAPTSVTTQGYYQSPPS